MGHVGVINKSSNKIPLGESNNSYEVSISVSGKYPVGDEKVEDSWTKLGTSGHVFAVIGGYWKIKWTGLFWPEFFYVSKGELNGLEMLEYTNRRRGRGYCQPQEVAYAKWVIPTRFICSSLPWRAVKTMFELDIGDWWKSTIFPAGIYLSDHTKRIVSSPAPWIVDPNWVGYEEWDAPERQKSNERRKRSGINQEQEL